MKLLRQLSLGHYWGHSLGHYWGHYWGHGLGHPRILLALGYGLCLQFVRYVSRFPDTKKYVSEICKIMHSLMVILCKIMHSKVLIFVK